MAEYVYTDANNHIETIMHRMLYTTAIICATCGLLMWRVPQSFLVNWGGIRPSQGELAPAIKEYIKRVPENRDKQIPGKAPTVARLEGLIK
jgi:hypothetical protein